MATKRRRVLPIIGTVIAAVIAIALVKLAFFGGDARVEDDAVPTMSLSEPEIPVTRAEVRTDITLTGTVSFEPAVPVTVPKTGTVIDVFVGVGQRVEQGAVLASVREDRVAEDGTTTAIWSEIDAPTSGVLTAFSPRTGVQVAPADVVGAVATLRYRIVAPINAEARFRLGSVPDAAEVTVSGAAKPFQCTGLRVSEVLPGTEGGDASGGASARCAVPADITVYQGAAATLTLSGGVAENALTVPVTAVIGDGGTGEVFRPGPDGSPESVPVQLGLRDGTNVEVLSGLSEGDSVYQFVPLSVLSERALSGDGTAVTESTQP